MLLYREKLKRAVKERKREIKYEQIQIIHKIKY